MTQADLARLLNEYRVRIDARLDHYLTDPNVPARLLEAMRYSVLAPGKRIRPILALLTSEACGGVPDDALPAACAVEMVHAFSLIHDDLPAMDDDDLRRGRPTCHKQFDEATAILAGDALLALAFEILTELQPADLTVRCVRQLAHATGTLGMIGGQMDDILNEENADATVGILRTIHCRKTGALLAASVRLGASVGLQGRAVAERETILDALTTFAEHLGLAFQIKDDLLDVHSTVESLGKAAQKDAGRGKLTYPGLLGVDVARQHLMDAFQSGLSALQSLGSSADTLRALLTFVVERDR